MAQYEGKILKVDTVMPSGHIYSKEVIEDGLKDFKKKLEAGVVFGTFGDKSRENYTSETFTQDISHKVDDLYVNADGELWGKIETLPPPNGRIADDIMCNCDFAIRAFGNVHEDNTVTDLHILSVDLVLASNPDKHSVEIV